MHIRLAKLAHECSGSMSLNLAWEVELGVEELKGGGGALQKGRRVEKAAAE